MSTSSAADENEFLLERRALGLSMATGLVLAVVGITIGVTTGSQIILFDGFYTFLGIGLSWMAMRVSILVASGPTSRYPFGREALTPLIIGVEGVALLATCAYATFNAVLTIIHGGSRLPSGWGVGYAGVALVVPTGLWWWMRRSARHSELVGAEATQWLAGGVLGSGMLVAFIFARLIGSTSWSPAAKYVDPALVIAACLLFVTPPLRMIRVTFIELVEGSPDVDIQGPARRVVDEVGAEFGLGERYVRMTKIGRKFYVEIDFIVAPQWNVLQSDQVRRALGERLSILPHDLWLTVEFTADRSLVE
ncbi:MAG TPA: cation transporter [Acidimicrobiales bacterium]|nr:cation transporter [Acidimicrobiales bacterium]